MTPIVQKLATYARAHLESSSHPGDAAGKHWLERHLTADQGPAGVGLQPTLMTWNRYESGQPIFTYTYTDRGNLGTKERKLLIGEALVGTVKHVENEELPILGDVEHLHRQGLHTRNCVAYVGR